MIRKIVIRNKSGRELRLMIEPWADQKGVQDGGEVTVKGDFSEEEEVIIDVYEDYFLSIWTPPDSSIESV